MGVAQYDVRPVSLAMQMPPEMQLKQVTKENVKPQTAQRIIKQFKETGSTARKQGFSCPTKLTNRDRHEIV